MHQLLSSRFANSPVLLLLLGALCLHLWLVRWPDILWINALGGLSPMDWVAHLNHPDNFQKDFPSGILVYGKSSFMHIYAFAQRWFEISPQQLLPAMVFFDVAFLAVCGFVFSRAIAPNAPIVAAWTFAVLLVGSTVRSMDLANFGHSGFLGYYYNAADGLRLLGIVAYLKRRPISAAAMLAASFTVHPLMALMGGIVVLGLMIGEVSAISPKRLLLASMLAASVTGGWLAFAYSNTNISSGGIDPQIWANIARTFNAHFFTVDLGVLTEMHDRFLLPNIGLLALAFHYLQTHTENIAFRRSLTIGIAILVAITVAGLVIQVYLPWPGLLKLALPRASDMLVLVELAIVIPGLYKDITSASLPYKVLAAGILVSPFIMGSGFPVLPVLLLILPRAWRETNCTRAERLGVFGSCGALVAVSVGYWHFDVAQPMHLQAYLGSKGFYIFLAGLCGILTLFKLVEHFKKSAISLDGIVLGSVVISISALAYNWQVQRKPGDEDRRLGQDYMEAQVWAKENTSSDALFMPDPTIYYGWRDFSQRSSFGNLIEWIHNSWMYDSRIDLYQEGMRRFGEFGIQLEPYLHYKPGNIGHFRLTDAVRSRFYDMPPVWFKGLSNKYGISHIVLMRVWQHQSYPFKKVFENKNFVVYQI